MLPHQESACECFKLVSSAAVGQVAREGAPHTLKEKCVGSCPGVEVEVASVKIPCVLDTGSQVTLLNAIFSCWKSIFQGTHPGISAFRVTVSSSTLGQWEWAFAVCNCVAQEDSVDGRIGVAQLTKQSAVEIPPQSEMVVWAQVQGGESLPHGSVLMEGVPEGTEWQVARTLACFKGGKVPVRIQNVNSYPISIPQRTPLASVFLLSPDQIHCEQELVLSAAGPDVVDCFIL